MQQSLYQTNRQQLFLMAAAIFVSVTAAVIVSTVIIMSLMRGEIASALASNATDSSPTAQTVSSCVAPPTDEHQDATAKPVATTSVAPTLPHAHAASVVKHLPTLPAKHSFNSTNTSNTTTTNNITNTEVNTTTDSYNPVVVSDNTVNVASNNNTAVNSGNTTTNTTTTTTNVATTNNVNSNNTVASNNTLEQHLLSDNVVIAVPPTI